MSTIATLAPSRVQVDPGAEADVTVQIQNAGELVEAYHLEPLGELSEWATIEPADIEGLLPGTATTARISFRPPRSPAVRSGEVAFGIKVTSTTYPEGEQVPEGIVEVQPFFETTTELSPRITNGRLFGRHRLAVDNRGNIPITVLVAAADAKQALVITARPTRLTVNPGEAGFIDLTARPVRTIWRGPDLTHPFSVTAASAGGVDLASDGTFVQRAILPPWLLKALLVALALLAALAVVWFVVLKQTVETAARAAVQEPVQQAEAAAAAAQEAAIEAGTASEGAASSAGSAHESLNEATEVLAGLSTPPEILTPTSERLSVTSPPGGQPASDAYVVPPGATFRLTDLVLSNPQGDAGRMTIELGNKRLFDLALENFRDLDFHFQAPIVAGPGQAVSMQVTCREVGVPPALETAPGTCDSAAYLGGTLVTPNPAAANPEP